MNAGVGKPAATGVSVKAWLAWELLSTDPVPVRELEYRLQAARRLKPGLQHRRCNAALRVVLFFDD
jgi:hypothetical protein